MKPRLGPLLAVVALGAAVARAGLPERAVVLEAGERALRYYAGSNGWQHPECGWKASAGGWGGATRGGVLQRAMCRAIREASQAAAPLEPIQGPDSAHPHATIAPGRAHSMEHSCWAC